MKFYNAIKTRSDENEKALQWLIQEKLYSLIGSIIRLELDSLIRLCYIKALENENENEKNSLLEQFFNGERWSVEKQIITDRKMVTYVTNSLMLGWVEPIYDIGCAFIHLSPYHDYANLNPTQNLSNAQRKTIVDHVESHHKIRLDINFGFNELVNIAPLVFKKLRDNLLYEIESFI